MKTVAVVTAAIGLALVAPPTAAAQNLITNPSFENPALTTPGQTTTTISGWTSNPVALNGVAYNVPELSTSFGSQWVYYDNQIAQQTATTIEADQTYTLTGHFGVRTDRPMPTPGLEGNLELYAGGAALDGYVTGGTYIGGGSITLVQGVFTPTTFVWTVPPGSPLVGQLLSVRLATNGTEIAADNISLSVPAPVPTLSEWAMIIMGLIMAGGALARIQRQRMTA